MLFTYLLLAFAIITGVNCLFFLFFSKFPFSKHKKSSTEHKPVSVIVYIKNQANVIDDFLPKLINQNHSNFELILINNASSDNTLDVLEPYKAQNIKIVDVENNEAFWGSKKYALTLGIKKASHRNLLFITPNVIELSENWITETSGLISEDKEIIVGYNNFQKVSGLFSKIIRYNRLQSSIQNFGIGDFSKPYKAWQNNLGFSSELFFLNNGYSSHMNVTLESENLFLKEVSTNKNVVLATSKEATTYNKNLTFGEWFKKSRGSLASAAYFSGFVKFNLGLFFITQALFWTGAIGGSLIYQNTYWFAIIGFRFLITAIIIGKSAFKLSEKDLFYLFPFLEITNIFLQLCLFLSNLLSKPKH